MSLQRHKSFFDDEELKALQRVFDAACASLKLNRYDGVGRERLGALVFEIARRGEGDEAVLQAHAVRRFDPLAATSSGPVEPVTSSIFTPPPTSRQVPRRES